MDRLNALHNKTSVVATDDMPYNPANILLQPSDLRALFDANGLEHVQFSNINLYRNAFVHKSYIAMKNDDFVSANEKCPAGCLPLQEMSYERLEFLGDAILGMIVARYFYERYPDQAEGFLSRMRTKVVNGKMLGHLAAKVGFPKFAIISRQIEDTQGRTNYKIMEDIFEAFIGALCMDFQADTNPINGIVPLTGIGYYIAELWVVNIMETHLDIVELIQERTNYKDMLVRHMQCTFQDMPRFLELSVDTRFNRKIFKYCVKDRAGAVIGTASGSSRKDAENVAALAALGYYGISVGTPT